MLLSGSLTLPNVRYVGTCPAGWYCSNGLAVSIIFVYLHYMYMYLRYVDVPYAPMHLSGTTTLSLQTHRTVLEGRKFLPDTGL